MTNKLFHTQNDEALISNVHFDPAFNRLRKQKSNCKIPIQYKEALERSIKNKGNMAVVNSKNIEDG